VFLVLCLIAPSYTALYSCCFVKRALGSAGDGITAVRLRIGPHYFVLFGNSREKPLVQRAARGASVDLIFGDNLETRKPLLHLLTHAL